MDMRGLDTKVRKRRQEVFTEIAKVAYNSENLVNDIEEMPYKIVHTDKSEYWENVYRERAVVREQIRLAMGLSLRPENKPVHATQGVEESNIAEKYYEPPLMQVIPSACNMCEENKYVISDQCQGCMAQPCSEVCPRGAISYEHGKSVIDQTKCIKCGKCRDACPYDAITRHSRPCQHACGVKAIKSDELGRAYIDSALCVSCGMCMVSCPFGAIADKSQILQLIRAMQSGRDIYVALAPAFVGQFGADATPEKIKAALLELGFKGVYEVAVGADEGAMEEAKHYVDEVATGKVPFLLTSCCPSWASLAKKHFPDVINNISNALTPMVATARMIKQEHPEAGVVFIGPCAAKKLEASRRTVRSDVDFVITFEELSAMFTAKGIYLNEAEDIDALQDATAAGRGYAVAGGVPGAIEECIKEYYPGTEVHIEHAEGLDECRKMLLLAKAGKKNGCLIEGMACPGGCVAGAGTNIPIAKAKVEVKKFAERAEKKLPDKE